VQLPFHLALAINDATPGSIDYSANSDLQGLTSLQVMDKIIQAAADRGILIILDLHSFTVTPPPLPPSLRSSFFCCSCVVLFFLQTLMILCCLRRRTRTRPMGCGTTATTRSRQ
jgi:hypothetical protein